MDRGLWITWYNLPEDGRDAYLSWAHQMYIPDMLKRKGILFAAHYASLGKTPSVHHKLTHTGDTSIPIGDRYIMMFGAESSEVLADPAPTAIHASLSAEDQKMLAMRIGVRSNIFAEAARVSGPEAANYKDGINLSPCIQIGSFNCAWEDEEEMAAWYAQWRMPAMTRTPGIIRTRKLASVAGWAKHSILYEWTTLELRNHYFPIHEEKDAAMKAWSSKMVPKLIHAPGSSNVATRIWPPLK